MDKMIRIWFPPAILPIVLLTLLTLQVSQAQAQNYQGEISLDEYSGNDYTITSIKAKYHFSTLFQEPLKKYHMWWESDATSLSSTSTENAWINIIKQEIIYA